MKGFAILNNPFLNKGTAFTEQEREDLGLTGLLPSAVQTLEEQVDQAYAQYQQKPKGLEQRLFLMNIFNTNRTLFYKLIDSHIVEMLPIVYDPVIAQSIEQYHNLFTRPQGVAFISIDHPEAISSSLEHAAGGRHIRLIVVTDAEGILGIGDWGVNGVDIAIGKLMVYTAAAGINPEEVLPVSLDVGTNNHMLLNNPRYLGNRHPRISGIRYMEFVDQFVTAARSIFPDMLLHWEDFGRENAANILNKYAQSIPTFNDDIQGTGIVTLAGILGALNISKEQLTDQRVMSFGAGTAGCGIAAMIYEEMVRQGLEPQEARSRFYLVDKQGLLFDDTPGLTPAQRQFTRQRSEFTHSEALTTLAAAVATVRPTILIGTSTQPHTFTKAIVQDMAAHTARPIIFPLSNPTQLAEATAEDLIEWTYGRALVATGIPADPVEYNGITYTIGQANNALMYPGLGLGLLASHAKLVTRDTLSAASHALGGIVDPTLPGAAVLPPVSELTTFSRTIARAVIRNVIAQHLSGVNIEPTDNAIDAALESTIWKPEYRS